MLVFVESCWGGGQSTYFRLTLKDGRRFSLSCEEWNRKTARKALDLLEAEIGVDRRRVRFSVR